MAQNKIYSPTSKKEKDMMRTYVLQKSDAKAYFLNCIRPRLDRSYKLYIADNRDRAKEIKKWQANVFVPYINAVVETLKPRILDARPEFTVQGRTEDDQIGAQKIQSLADYTWEISDSDKVAEQITSSALIYGMGYIQVGWKKDVRELSFLSSKDLAANKYKWKTEKRVFYDAPFMEWVDNYCLWYDWHNTEEGNKQYWFKRLLLPMEVIKRRYPMIDKARLEIAMNSNSGDLTDYGSVRNEVKLTHDKITKGSDYSGSGGFMSPGEIFKNAEIKMGEVFEWVRPFDDEYAVMVNDVPVLKNASMPIPYDFKETMFIGTPYLKVPGEYEGYGLPMLLENPQIMLNMIKNQRLDATTLNIHKMWIVNPLANINKDELVARPFGIVYSTDPNGAREIQMSDIKQSAYREEELLKGDMRYASGVDDASMGNGGGASSATEVRHLRESTLERVRLFVNHLGDSYSKVMRYWISMYKQFYTAQMIIRITGDDGELKFPVIEKDDLMGNFDYKATVIPSIAGQNDIKKKQDMDLFQLLVQMPFIDPEKLTSKILHDFNWNIQSVRKAEEQQAPEEGMLPEEEMQEEQQPEPAPGGQIPSSVAQMALDIISGGQQSYNPKTGGVSPIKEMSAPVNLLKTGGAIPPTPIGAGSTTNSRGMNRKIGGKVNTNIPLRQTASPESSLMNRVNNLQS